MAGTWTCSEDEDFGSLGDNKLIVTGGTAIAPAEMSDFVTADRAGEAVLLAAVAGSATNTLTYQIRPCELRALLISCIVASKTTEADYIFITGTDAWDNAQTESLDVSAGNGTYVATKYFRTITNLDCSDNSAGGGTVWADGTIHITQPQWGFVWDHGNGQYKIDLDEWDIGDNSTTTYFSSTQEMVHTKSVPRVRHNATHVIGKPDGDWSIEGSYWSFGNPASSIWQDWSASSVQIYGSMIENRDDNYIRHRFGTSGDGLIIKNSIISGRLAGSNNYFDYNTAYMDIQRTYLNNLFTGFRSASAPIAVTMDKIHIHKCNTGIASNSAGVEASGILLTDLASIDIHTESSGSTLIMVDPDAEPTAITNNDAANETHVKYTTNIHITDKDGANISGATVTLDTSESGDYDTEAFSVSTAADGTITEQTVLKKKWVGTSETLTDYEPWRFTIAKAGYKTLMIEEIDPLAPIVYRFELQPIEHPPAMWEG